MIVPLVRPPRSTVCWPLARRVSEVVPPDETISVPPPDTAGPMARPPRSTVSWPLARRVFEVVPPDETISVPPPDTVVSMAVPALRTTCDPAKITAPLARPESIWMPPEICAPRSVPPLLMVSEPPE
jgi:hypothetical protein